MATRSTHLPLESSVQRGRTREAVNRPRIALTSDNSAPSCIPLFETRDTRTAWQPSWIVVFAGVFILLASLILWRAFADSGSALIVAIAVIAVQAVVIAALALSRARLFRAEKCYRENEEAMALAAASGNIGLWSWDVVQDRIRLTPHCRIILGLKPDESCDFRALLNGIHPDDCSMFRDAIERAKATGQTFDVEHRTAPSSADVRWIAASGRFKYDKQRRATTLTGAFVDISHRKQAEAEADRQRKYVTHLTRVSMLGELSGAVAHELNQPLTAIMSNAQAVQRMLSRPTVDLIEVKNTIRDIIEDDCRAGEVIRHLRALLAKNEAKVELVDMNKVVTDALNLARADLIIRQVKIVKELSPELRPVMGDEIQLQQVVLNLVLNASEALMANEPDNRSLTISTLSKDGIAEAVFRDNGLGFSRTTMKRLFEPFFTTKEHGLGLGLPISRSIVTAHGGELSAESAAGGGALFRVVLPAVTPPSQ